MKKQVINDILGDKKDEFLKHFGGMTMQVPKSPSDKLLRVLGDRAWAFCRFFGGEQLYISKEYIETVQKVHDDFCQAVNYEIDIGIDRGRAIARQSKQFGWTTRWGQIVYKRYEIGRFTPKKLTAQLDFDW